MHRHAVRRGICRRSRAVGVFFRIGTDGTFTVLHNFTRAEGGTAPGSPVEAFDGNFYAFGISPKGYGSVYRMSPTGGLTILYSFDTSQDPHFAYPVRLMLGSDGALYGATNGVLSLRGAGTIFKMTTDGQFTILHTFSGAEGRNPNGPLAQTSDGAFYGTTYAGGSAGWGSTFRLAPDGTLTTLFNFHESDFYTLGYKPSAAIIQATDGNFYGGSLRTLWQMTPAGNMTELHDAAKSPGGTPSSTLFQHTTGLMFGTSYGGGSPKCVGGCGSVYSLDVGLGPFVRILPVQSASVAGTTIGILGQSLAGASRVSFAGTPAQFTVVSNTFITATVPVGATSGPVVVNVGGSSVSSNVAFRRLD
jgi:uncharacterized repeat protein (TIGR03803 family)